MALSSTKPTQDFVPIKEVRDGIVILKDNSLCAIIMASSINFALKSQDEQEAILMQYQSFLNSLDFVVQLFVQSRKVNIQPYLLALEETEKKQVNETMVLQTREYIKFVKELVAERNIVSKTFYIAVPYNAGGVNIDQGSFLGKLFGGTKAGAQKQNDDNFAKNKLQLEQRLSIVQGGLIRCGIRTQPLNTEEIIELFYKMFNPGEIDKSFIQTLRT